MEQVYAVFNAEWEVPITPKLRDMLLAQAALNPYDEGLKGFVFFGLIPEQPTNPKKLAQIS